MAKRDLKECLAYFNKCQHFYENAVTGVYK